MLSNLSSSLGVANIRSIIKDPIYEYIPINDLEHKLLQTHIVNRLHYIKQLGPAYLVYPTAKHTRFSHSLGVMHLMGLMANIVYHQLPEEIRGRLFINIYNNRNLISRICKKIGNKCNDKKIIKLYFIQFSRLAGLFHDIGHLPFSHLMEDAIFEYLNEYNKQMKDSLIQRLMQEGFADGKPRLHEYLSYKIILLSEDIKNILSYYSIPSSFIALSLIPNYNKMKEMYKKLEREYSDMYKSYVIPSINMIWLIQNMLSGDIDADRLDYITRDAYFSGLKYGVVEVSRILYGITVTVDKNNFIKLVFKNKVLSDLEDVLDARYKMYKWLYYHHKVIAFSEIIKRIFIYVFMCENEPIFTTERKLIEIYSDPNTLINISKTNPSLVNDQILYKIIDHRSRIIRNLKNGDRERFERYIDIIINRKNLITSLIKREGEFFNILRNMRCTYFEKWRKMIYDKIHYRIHIQSMGSLKEASYTLREISKLISEISMVNLVNLFRIIDSDLGFIKFIMDTIKRDPNILYRMEMELKEEISKKMKDNDISIDVILTKVNLSGISKYKPLCIMIGNEVIEINDISTYINVLDNLYMNYSIIFPYVITDKEYINRHEFREIFSRILEKKVCSIISEYIESVINEIFKE